MTESNHLPVQSEVELTEETHTCWAIPCKNPECELTALWVVEPEYDLNVGWNHAVPKEICFAQHNNNIQSLPDLTTEIPSSEPEPEDIASRHVLASKDVGWVSTCSCGHVNSYFVDESGGMILFDVAEPGTDRKVRVPVSHVSFITTPAPDWDVTE